MEDNLLLVKSIVEKLETFGKGVEIIDDTFDEFSRKKEITLGDIFIGALKITLGSGISYISADGIKQDIVKIGQNIEIARQHEINNQRLIPFYMYMHPFNLPVLNWNK